MDRVLWGTSSGVAAGGFEDRGAVDRAGRGTVEALLPRSGDDYDWIRDRDALLASEEAKAGDRVVDRLPRSGKWFRFRGNSSELIE